MIHWSANVGTLYAELPVMERFAAAARSGFKYVEMWCPFPAEAAVADAISLSATDLVGFLYEPGGAHGPGEMAAGQRGILNGTAKMEDCLEFFRRSVAFAKTTSSSHIAVLVGNVVDDRERELAWAADALRRACEITEPAGLMVVVEPLNSFDTPSYLLHDAGEAAEFVRSLRRPGARLLLDVYHVAREGADPVALIPRFGKLIGHVQVADSPGRGAPRYRPNRHVRRRMRLGGVRLRRLHRHRVPTRRARYRRLAVVAAGEVPSSSGKSRCLPQGQLTGHLCEVVARVSHSSSQSGQKLMR